MKIYYLFSDKLDSFREKIEENLEYYKNGQLKFVKANDLVAAPKIFVENLKFDMSKSKPNETDYENIKRFYLAFKHLSNSQATEERLWAGLCHSNFFWDYLKYRWDCKDQTEVLARYFFSSKDGRRPIFYNGLARLWWYGRMTYDENAKDPFELTKYICENLTTKGYLTMTFAFSHNRNICKTYLRAMMNFEKENKLTVDEYLKSRRYIDLFGGKILLDSISDEELTKKINDYLNKLIKNRKVKQEEGK
jgi:hypothetical protein